MNQAGANVDSTAIPWIVLNKGEVNDLKNYIANIDGLKLVQDDIWDLPCL